MKNSRLVFDDYFYRLGAVLLSKKFLKLKKETHRRYAEINLPFPIEGFADLKSYKQWLKKAVALANKEDKPGIIIENILRKFNLDTKNENYRNGLSAKMFFNKELWDQSPYSKDPIGLIIRNQDSSRELYVKIEPWTKKSDYVKLWGSIKNIQKTLIGYRSKEKFQTTFGRDFAVYQLYLEVKSNIKSNNPSYNLVIDRMLDYPEYQSLSKQFKDENIDDQIRAIKSRFDRLLKNVEIL